MTWQFVPLADVPPSPWKNGAGVRLEMGLQPVEQVHTLAWRSCPAGATLQVKATQALWLEITT